jgi:hypothetical protein
MMKLKSNASKAVTVRSISIRARNALAVVTLSLVVFSNQVWAQDSGPDNVELLEEAEPNVLSVLTTDDKGQLINGLAPELYEDVIAALAGQEVQFPVACTEIISVMPLPGETFKDKILVKYEGSPAKTMLCKWINGQYRCRSS